MKLNREELIEELKSWGLFSTQPERVKRKLLSLSTSIVIPVNDPAKNNALDNYKITLQRNNHIKKPENWAITISPKHKEIRIKLHKKRPSEDLQRIAINVSYYWIEQKQQPYSIRAQGSDTHRVLRFKQGSKNSMHTVLYYTIATEEIKEKQIEDRNEISIITKG